VGKFQRPVEMDRGVSGARQAGLQQGQHDEQCEQCGQT